MADWTNIANTALQPGAPVRSIDGVALRDNPIAIAEGAAGAPRIVNDAITNGTLGAEKFQTGTTERDWVLARTASASVGAVGTYGIFQRNSNASPGDLLAGSALTYSGILTSISAAGGTCDGGDGGQPFTGSVRTFSFNAGASTSPSGTWRCMGRISRAISVTGECGSSSSMGTSTLWLRVS